MIYTTYIITFLSHRHYKFSDIFKPLQIPYCSMIYLFEPLHLIIIHIALHKRIAENVRELIAFENILSRQR